MPKSIKPKMSNDVLAPFDNRIHSVTYDEGTLELIIEDHYGDSGIAVCLDEKDLESMLSFLRMNKLKEKK